MIPQPADRRAPGALRYRIGTHGRFVEAMLERLSAPDFPALARLTARTPDDPAIALLDAWATIADVLTFYQERMANEGFLGTAIERRSILELGRLVGYELRPGLASTAFLAFTVDPDPQDPNRDRRVTIPRRSRAQTVPDSSTLPQLAPTQPVDRPPAGPDPRTLPQTFETAEPLDARAWWSDLRPRLRRPPLALDPSDLPGTLWFTGTDLALLPGSLLLFMLKEGTIRVTLPVAEAVADTAAGQTRVQLLDSSRDTRLGELAKDVAADLAGAIATLAPEGSRKAVAVLLDEVLLPLARSISGRITAADLAGHLEGAIPRLREAATSLGRAHAAVLQDQVAALATAFGDRAARARRLDPASADVGQAGPAVILLPGGDAPGGVVLGEGPSSPTLARLTAILPAIRRAPSVPPQTSRDLRRDLADGFGTASDGPLRLIAALDRRVGPSLLAALAGPDRRPAGPLVSAYRVRCQPFGAVSPQPRNSDNEPTSDGPLFTGLGAPYGTAAEAGHGLFRLALDAVYEAILPGSWVTIQRGERDPATFRVDAVATIGAAAFGLSARVTRLTLAEPWLRPGDDGLPAAGQLTTAVLRDVVVHAAPVPLELADEPITACIAGDEILLDRLHDGLEPGRWVIVAGERCDVGDVAGVPAAELAMIAGVRNELDPDRPGDVVRTTLRLATPLAYQYVRATARVLGNVVKATHGETREEALGSGDPAVARQAFALGAKPLTWLASAGPSGASPALDVRVDGLSWESVNELRSRGPRDRVFVLRTDDGDRVTIAFGDGTHGARPGSGAVNIAATYRTGVGAAGNVAPSRITQLTTRPLGVSAVENPLPATGGADREGLDQGRRNIPLGVQALDRLVSVEDYAAFARARAGIGRARAALVSDGRRELIQVTIAGVDDAPIDPTSDLHRALVEAITLAGDPGLPFAVDARELLLLLVSASVRVQPGRRWVDVEPAVRAALVEGFSFARRDLAQPVYLAEVQTAIAAVRGVAGVDVDVLDAVAEADVAGSADLGSIGQPTGDQPRAWVPARPARVEDGERRPAQLALLSAAIPETLALREATP